MTNTTIPPELLDQLLEHYQQPEDILGEGGLLKQLTKAVLERALQAEMVAHLGHERGEPAINESGNVRNGSGAKTIQGEFGPLELEVPRDREGSFVPLIVPKHKRRIAGLDEKIVALHARGSSTRDIQAQLQELYGIEVSPALVSSVTEAVLEEVKAWQARPLEAVYPILYLDCLHLKIRDNGAVRTKAVYLAIGVNLEGQKEVLGMWLSENEGAKFWLLVLTELKNRGLQDVFVVCVDGLKGFPEAIEASFPKAQVQLCIVHLLRYSLNFVSWKERKAVATDLKTIYRAPTVEAGEAALATFAEKWDACYPSVSQTWRRNWARVVPFFGFPPEIRRVIYTTNAIESLNFSLRKLVKTKGAFPSDEAALKLLYLGLRSVAKRWTMPVTDWRAALNWFAVLYEDRLPQR